ARNVACEYPARCGGFTGHGGSGSAVLFSFDACPDRGIESTIELRRAHLAEQRALQPGLDVDRLVFSCTVHDSISVISPASAARRFRPRCNNAFTVPVGM